MKKKLIAVATLATLSAITAFAVPLTEGNFTALPGTTAAARPELAGTVLVDTLDAFSISLATGGQITGTIQSRVVRETVSGTLDFYWRVINDANSAGSIGSFRMGEFFTGGIDADWRIDGLGTVAPDNAYLFGGSLSGQGYVNFNFSNGLGAGQESMFMFLHTDAVDFDKSAIMDVAIPGHTRISQLFSTYAPTQSVPDAGSTLALAGLAFAGLLALRRRLV